MSTVSRRIVAAFAPVGLALATAAVVVAPAAADVDDFDVEPGIDGSFATTCTYEIRAEVDTTKKVAFRDNGVLLARVTPVNWVATYQWTPRTVGVHFLTASQWGEPGRGAETVVVVPGLNLGSLCFGIG